MNYLLFQIINIIFQLLYLCLIIRVVLSWIPHDPYQPILRLVYSATEPILKPIREIIPPLGIGIDISPIIAFIALGLIKKILVWALF